MKEWSEHITKAISKLSTLANPGVDSLISLIYEFKFWNFFYIFLKLSAELGDNS